MLPSDAAMIKRMLNIRVSGYEKFVSYRDLTIRQTMNSHCTFEFFWRISDKIMTEPAEDFRHFRNHINSDVMFSFHNRVTDRDILFKGVVTHLSVVNRDGAHAGYWVRGSSHTICMDDLRYNRQFLDLTLKDIFEETLKSQALGMWEPEHMVPQFKGRIAHSMQSNENGWQYLTRLAANYGEWLYWDGTRLQLGQLRDSKTVLLNGSDLDSFEMSSDVVSNKVSLSVFDVDSATTATGAMDKTTDAFKDSLINTSIDAQSSLFPRKTGYMPYHEYASNATSKDDIERMNQLYTSGKAVSMATYIAVSKIPINVGNIVTVNDRGISHPLIVIESTITSTGIGNVTCRFVGIPLDSQYPPYTNPLLHGEAKTQPAIVMDNNDPEGLGRVKVAYSWGAVDSESPWLRMDTPYAGESKGLYFIPEIGEEVRVGFEDNNPDKAFVAASRYNGQANSGYANSKNAIKAIHTRSGTKIVFNDDQGSIAIEDPGGSVVRMDGKGEITIHAPKRLRLHSEEIVIDADEIITVTAGTDIAVTGGEHVAITAGMDLKETSGANYSLTAKNITKIADGTITTQAKTAKKNAAEDIEMSSEKGSVNKSAKKEVQVNSGETSKLF